MMDGCGVARQLPLSVPIWPWAVSIERPLISADVPDITSFATCLAATSFAERSQETAMADRENSPAFQMLPLRARRVLAAIETAIGDRSSASISFTSFQFDHRIGRPSISPSLKLLDHLGLIEVEPGPRLINIFRLSNRWRTIDEGEAVRLAELAREVMSGRRFREAAGTQIQRQATNSDRPSEFIGQSINQSPPKSQQKPMTVARPRIMQRRVPSLPTMPCAADGR